MKYLEVWFDRGMQRNVLLEKMKMQRNGQLRWMSRNDELMEVERGRLVWSSCMAR